MGCDGGVARPACREGALDGEADRLIGLESQRLEPSAPGRRDPQVGIHRPQERGRVVDGDPQLLLAGVQLGLGGAAFGEVVGHADRPDHGAGGV